MGRRSSHSAEELRRLILTSTRSIIENDGISGLSAREIARKIDYSPGTIYNFFTSIDELLLTIQIELVEEALAALEAAHTAGEATEHIKALARTYMAFAMSHQALWSLFFCHQPPAESANLSVLDAQFEAIVNRFVRAMPRVEAGEDRAHETTAARAVWAALHGISGVAVMAKHRAVTSSNAEFAAMELIEGYVASLGERQAQV